MTKREVFDRLSKIIDSFDRDAARGNAAVSTLHMRDQLYAISIHLYDDESRDWGDPGPLKPEYPVVTSLEQLRSDLDAMKSNRSSAIANNLQALYDAVPLNVVATFVIDRSQR